MVRAGDAFENPVSGQRLTFNKTARDTDGGLLEVESIYTRPSSSRPPAHYHPRQVERFEILSGALHILIGGEERTLGAGEVLVIPPGISHTMWAEEAGTRVNWQTRPALKTEAFFETVWGLAQDGKTNPRGVPNLLRAALIAWGYEDEYRLASLPWALQKALFGPLAAGGRWLGYEARYPYSSGGRYEVLGTANEHSSVASRVRTDVVLLAFVISLLVLVLLWGWRRAARVLLIPL